MSRVGGYVLEKIGRLADLNEGWTADAWGKAEKSIFKNWEQEGKVLLV